MSASRNNLYSQQSNISGKASSKRNVQQATPTAQYPVQSPQYQARYGNPALVRQHSFPRSPGAWGVSAPPQSPSGLQPVLSPTNLHPHSPSTSLPPQSPSSGLPPCSPINFPPPHSPSTLQQRRNIVATSPYSVHGPSSYHVASTSGTVHYRGDHTSSVSHPYGTNGITKSACVSYSPARIPLQSRTSTDISISPSVNINLTNLKSSKQVKVESQDDDLTDPNLTHHQVLEYFMEALEVLRVNYREKLQELFFLQNGGNMVDYPAWKKRPNPQLLAFLNASRLDDEMTVSTPTATNTVSPSLQVQASYSTPFPSNIMTSYPSYHGNRSQLSEPPDVKTVLPQMKSPQGQMSVFPQAAVSAQFTFAQSNIKSHEPQIFLPTSVHQEVTQAKSPIGPKISTSQGLINGTSTQSVSSLPRSIPAASVAPSPKITTKQQALGTSVTSYGLGTQEDIVLQAKREQDILNLVTELRKNGLWSASRLPKVYEPPRKKTHWDYLLEEMQWLATDFSQERRWKRAMAKKISRSVMKYHQDRRTKEQKAKKEESTKLRRIASSIAKEVRLFWQSVEKVAQYKQQSRLEERRKKALDIQLNFIVGQTEKYSSWLVEGLKSSERDSSVSSPVSSLQTGNESDFAPEDNADDDEDTIAKEEEHDDGSGNYVDELEALKRESEMSLDDILDSLPHEMLDRLRNGASSDNESTEDEEDSWDEMDQEFVVTDETAEDDDETLAEQEKEERGNVDHEREILELQAESEMPVSEILKKYGALNSKNEQTNVKNEEEWSSEDVSDDDGIQTLVTDQGSEESNVPDQELNDAAATAESLQPKGFTLSTTEVRTTIPFLLRHVLREYQHIGLDWLVTMYDKQLNGILADEMGLGKTIQTIALLAHLACDKHVWGPHLVVVPTSVMLNWEYEFKKWCPAFKILTYYGTQKERKQKRQGWSKPNAFHVCVTSYKLVIQDHQSFRRKKWKYLILDEAQNIKNFKSQRWQMLLNFNSQRRLLLTGTPLQNSLMELWSLMHFLMPHLFTSHQDFKEWFSNPLSGMIEGSREYNEKIVSRLHKVLRPFLLRRLKCEVETQMPKKYEHVVRCYLSKRQRYLYDEFMARTKTKETLESGNFLSVINILMQLRKVCNHPDLFEPRPTVSPFSMEGITHRTASLVLDVFDYKPLEEIKFSSLNLAFADIEVEVSAFGAYRTQQLKVSRPMIEEIDSHDKPFHTYPNQTTRPSSGTLSVSLSPLPSLATRPLSAIAHDLGNGGKDYHGSPLYRMETRSPSDFLLSTAGLGATGDPFLEVNEIDVVGIDESDFETENEPAVVELLDEYVESNTSPHFMGSVKDMHRNQRRQRLKRMATVNDRHCEAQPIYGSDLCVSVKVCRKNDKRWIGSLSHQYGGYSCHFLKEIVKTPEERLEQLDEIFKRFVIAVPSVEVQTPLVMHVSHPAPSMKTKWDATVTRLEEILSPAVSCLSLVARESRVQFPETRLIQYDCGKLQALDILLRKLKVGKHRVLIFTQMTRMLDVLEKFLNYHGYIYLRLDGTTKIEQRQILMERFNQDSRIFCFILSTRSGGLGVNLTGADTVVFYDSDWNPTMDAQAQDRCHRIGQTRDVHIYRLICERTVEENILKKANQKRLLGDIAIEGGNFTTAFLKQNSIKELFDLAENKDEVELHSTQVPQKVVESKRKETLKKQKAADQGRVTEAVFEQALSKAEDDQDVQAASQAKAEQAAELAEFNENIPINDEVPDDKSKVEEELAMLESELSPVERYALKFVEYTNSHLMIELEEAEKQVEMAKKDWELEHLQALKEAEERKNAEEEDEMFFTYIKDENYDQAYIDEYTGAEMPIWMPPTPPEGSEDEMYSDPTVGFLYEVNTIPDHHLPPTHFLKKNGVDAYTVKGGKEKSHYLGVFKKKRSRIMKPKSLFDKKALELLNKAKLKKSKLKQKAMTTPATQSTATPKPDSSQHGPEWLISEDWALYQAVNCLSELPLDLASDSLHNKLPNWDMVSDIVNSVSRIRRSARQCRDRYLNVIVPREEGKLSSARQELDPKQKRNKKGLPIPPKPHPPSNPQQKTQPQFSQDQGRGAVSVHQSRFEVVKKSSQKKAGPLKQVLSRDPNLKNAKHSFVLADNGISETKIPNPQELAHKRADRIAREKQQLAAAASGVQAQTISAAIQDATRTVTGQTRPVPAVSVAHQPMTHASKGTALSVAGQVVSTATILKGGLVLTSTTAVSSGTNTIVVNPPNQASFNAVGKRVSAQIPISLSQLSTNVVTTIAVSGTRLLQTQPTQGTSTPVVSQRLLPTAASLAVASSSASGIFTTMIPPGQIVRGVTGSITSTGTQLVGSQQLLKGKPLTPQHIALIRQNALQQQQQQQTLQKAQQQRLQQQKAQQLKLIQQQQQQQTQTSQQTQQQPQQQKTQQQSTTQATAQQTTVQQSTTQAVLSQATKISQQTVVTTGQLAGLTVQTMKQPMSVRVATPQQITAQQLTPQQQQQLLQQALQQKQLFQQKTQLQGQVASNPHIQQMITRQKLTPQQQIQLQQIHQQRQQLQQQQQQQQQLKFQQQQQQQQQQQGVAAVSQPKTQLVMTQVKPAQAISAQQLKQVSGVSTAQTQILQQSLQQQVSGQQQISQQILLRPTLTQVGTQQPIQVQQNIPQQIQLRTTAISGQTQQQLQQLRMSQPQQLQTMQGQVQLQSGTLVLQQQQQQQQGQQQQGQQQQQQPQGSQTLAQVIGTTQVQVVSSLSQQQRTLQAAALQQAQQQQQQLKQGSVQVQNLTQAHQQPQIQQQQLQVQTAQQGGQTFHLKVVTQPTSRTQSSLQQQRTAQGQTTLQPVQLQLQQGQQLKQVQTTQQQQQRQLQQQQQLQQLQQRQQHLKQQQQQQQTQQQQSQVVGQQTAQQQTSQQIQQQAQLQQVQQQVQQQQMQQQHVQPKQQSQSSQQPQQVQQQQQQVHSIQLQRTVSPSVAGTITVAAQKVRVTAAPAATAVAATPQKSEQLPDSSLSVVSIGDQMGQQGGAGKEQDDGQAGAPHGMRRRSLRSQKH